MYNMPRFRDDVSVIVPAYNAGLALIDALDSILKQTLQPAVVHIVDDQSPSDDAGLARTYIAEHQIKGWYVHQLHENLGAGGARDFGIRNSTTEYIALLDADDLWLPDHLASAFGVIDKFDLTLFGGRTHKMSRGEHVPSKTEEEHITQICLDILLLKCYFLTSTVVLKRASYLDCGGFLPGLKLSEDYSLWLRFAANLNNRCAVSNLVHALYRDSDTTTTRRLSKNHWAHERAELANFRYLHNQDSISSAQLMLSSGFSFLKYIKRLLTHH
ncbi:glycosyltransferase family 2 protein [Oryzomonas rubra]|uniref:Glycosyltransferase family 2 protein n=1 Tax=Oryzomonas rubra TaxID=2509454 RepID=A0A5A9XHQ7_9BACT|nr:glycosyltransferase family 2 protein [Oryzomonas rubra]